jgi:hypothetical protein
MSIQPKYVVVLPVKKEKERLELRYFLTRKTLKEKTDEKVGGTGKEANVSHTVVMDILLYLCWRPS